MKQLNLFQMILVFALSFRAYANDPIEYDAALKNAEAKSWEESRKLIQVSTDQNPTHARSWYLRAVISERFEDFEDAESSYSKFLMLEPNGRRADAAKERHAHLKIKVDERAQKRYNLDSTKFFLGYSPVWKPQLADELGSTLSSSIDLGFEFGSFFIGGKMGSGTVPGLMIPQQGVTKSPTYTTVKTEGKHSYAEIFFGFDISLNPPYKKLGPVALSIPIFLGGAMNTITLNGTKYGSIGYDFASGLKARYYSKSWYAFDFNALYHGSWPFWGVRQDGSSVSVKSLNGVESKSGMNGFEIRLGVSYLFGSELPPEPL